MIRLFPPSRPLRNRSAAALACGLALACGATSCAQKGGPPPARPVAVQTAPAQQMDVPLILTGFGSTSERASVDIVPQVSGMLLKRYFEDGAIVTNGQPLFLIDPSDYALRVQQAESMLAADCANSNLACSTLARNRTLLEQKLLSQADFDALQARLDAATAQVKSDVAALDQAKLNFARCAISAPLDGICSKHFLDEGNLASAGLTRLTNIRSYDPITVDFALSEEYLTVIRRAMQTPPVRIEVTPRGDTNSCTGTLVFMDNAVAPQTGTIALRGAIPNADKKLWVNQFVDVRVFAGMEHAAVMVPEGAVQFGKMGTYLFAAATTNYTLTITNTPPRHLVTFGAQAAPTVTTTNIAADIASLRVVRTGVRYHDLIQVFGGVAPGDRVVVLGQFILYPGASVADVSRLSPAAAGTNRAPGLAERPDPTARERRTP